MNAKADSQKRRWFRFRLRSLFVLVTLCCLAMGWYVVRVLPQQRAVAAIRADGGKCLYNCDYYASVWPFDRDSKLHWLPDLLGDDLFYSVIGVHLQPASDATLAHVGNLANLQALTAIEGSLTDEGLRHLSRLRQLRSLQIWNSSITGEGFAAIVALPHLEALHFARCNELIPAGQCQIGQLEHLNELTVWDCDSVTADCLYAIVARGKLLRLEIHECPLVDFTQLDLTALPPGCIIHLDAATTRTAPTSVDPDGGGQP